MSKLKTVQSVNVDADYMMHHPLSIFGKMKKKIVTVRCVIMQINCGR